MDTTKPDNDLSAMKEQADGLVRQKSYLQLIISMMKKLGMVVGLENTIKSLLGIIIESIGGTNATLYYLIDDETYMTDIQNEKNKIDDIADVNVKKVFKTRKLIEVAQELKDTKLHTPEFTHAFTWVLPLMEESSIIGVIKIDDLRITSQEFKNELPIFFNYAAVLLKNDILRYVNIKNLQGDLENVRKLNDKLIAANEKKKLNDNTYRALIENINIGIFQSTLDGKFFFANAAIVAISGYENVEEFLKIPAQNLYVENLDSDSVIKELRDKGFVKNKEMRSKKKNGDIYWIAMNALFIKDTEDKPISILGAIEDITERKHTEMEIARINRVLRMLSNINQALIHISDEANLLNEICRIAVEVGSYHMAWVGYTENDEAKTVRPVAHAGFDSGYIESAKVTWADNERGRGPGGTAIRTGQLCLARNILMDPTFAPWREAAIQRGYKSIIALPLTSESQTFGVIGIYSVETDAFDIREVEILKELADDLAFGITALRIKAKRRKAEERLCKEVERGNLLLELYEKASQLSDKQLYDYALEHAVRLTNSAIGFFHLISDDQKNVILTTWNSEALKNCTAAYDTHYPINIAGNWVDCVRLKRPVIYNDFVNSPNQKGLPKGHSLLHRFMSIPVMENDKVKIIFGVGNKIEEYDDYDVVHIQLVANELQKIIKQRHAEDALRKNENDLKEAQRLGRIGSWDWDAAKDKITWSEEYYHIFGFDPTQPAPGYQEHLKVYTPESATRLDDAVKRNMQTGEPYELDLELAAKEGQCRWITARSETKRDDKGQIVGLRGTAQDITERKHAEEALKEQYSTLRGIINSTEALIFSLDRQYRYTSFNHGHATVMKAIYGVELEIGHNLLDYMTVEEDRQKAKRNLDRALAGEQLMEEAYSGEELKARLYFQVSHSPIWTEEGEIIGVAVLSQDITERKQKEEALKKSETMLNEAQSIAHIGSWELNIVDNVLMWSDEIYRIFEIDPKKFGASYEAFLDAIHPDDRETVNFAYTNSLKTKVPYSIDHRLQFEDGRIKYVHEQCNTLYNADGKPFRSVGTVQDITERKQTEEALIESEERYKALFHGAVEGILVADAESKKFAYANHSICQMLGYTEEEMKCLSVVDIHPVESLKEVFAEFDAQFRGDKTLAAGLPCRRKDGSVIYANINASGMILNKKKYNVGFFTDVTELKHAEEALRESEKQVRRKLDAILSPEVNISALELSDIIDCEKIQKLMDKFYQVTNIGMAIIDLHGKVLVGTGWQEICTKFHRINPETCSLCVESDLELSRDVPMGTFKLYRCKNNMWDMASPIKLGDTLLGNFFLGQFLFEDEIPDYETFRQQARKYGFNEEEYIAALDSVPRWSHKTVDAVMSFYTSFAEMIGNLSYANVKLASTLEERKRAEEALRESEEKYRFISENTADAIWAWSLKTGKFTYVSAPVQKLRGYTPEEVMNQSLAETLTPESMLKATQLIQNAVKNVKPGDNYKNVALLDQLCKDGSVVSTEVASSLVFDEKGQPLEIIGVSRDITERKHAEEALRDSEEKYRSVIESAPVGIFIIKDELIQYVNPVMNEITGYTEQDVLGKHFLNFVAKKYREIEQQFYARRMKGEIFPSSYETGAIIKNGREIPVELTVSVFNLFGEKAEMVFVRDISERKEAERVLLQNKQELDSIYNTVGDMVFLLQVEEGDRFLYNSVNKTFEDYTGLKASVVVGKRINEIIPESMLAITIKKYHEAIKQKTIVRWEEKTQFPSGMLTCEYSVAPVFDIAGKCTHLVGSIHDITERKMIEERIKKLNEELEDRVKRRTKQLEAANNELEAFAHSVSHDLRAPLRGIDGFSQALLEDYQDTVDEQGKDYLRRVRSAAQRMGQLIDDMLNLSMVSRSDMNIQQVNLSEMFREIAADLQETQPERKVTFIIPEGIKAMGDSRLLHIVLENLIENAWKFTSKHPTARIEFGRQQQKEKLVYFIRDDGAGFDMNYAQKLFSTFQRLHTSAEFPGTGVGLATVQRVIHRHGGEVWAEAEIEKGSIFYFTIPKKQYHDK